MGEKLTLEGVDAIMRAVEEKMNLPVGLARRPTEREWALNRTSEQRVYLIDRLLAEAKESFCDA